MEQQTQKTSPSPNDGDVDNRRVNGVVQEFVGKVLTLVLADEIPVSATVTAQSKDLIYFGEIISCVPERGAKWTTQVRVKRTLLVI